MNEVVKFLEANPVQYVATEGLDGRPKVRPFQFMLERDGRLWFCTNNRKDVFAQLQKNPWLEACVVDSAYAWLRLSGRAVFEDNREIKEAVLAHCGLVKSLYGTADNPIFEVFYLAEAHAVIADFSGKPPREVRLN